jgi:hypothetical protein
VLTAAALSCLNGEILGRLAVKDEAQKERNLVFDACGVTDGNLLARDPLHRGWGAHAIHRDDLDAGAGAFHRHHASGKQARRKGSLPVAAGTDTLKAGSVYRKHGGIL